MHPLLNLRGMSMVTYVAGNFRDNCTLTYLHIRIYANKCTHISIYTVLRHVAMQTYVIMRTMDNTRVARNCVNKSYSHNYVVTFCTVGIYSNDDSNLII